MEERRPVGLIVKTKCQKSGKKRNCMEESRPMGLIVKNKYPKNGKKEQLRGRKPAHGAYSEEQVPEK